MDGLHVVEGLRGAENLFLGGFKYSKRRNRGAQFQTWRCSQYKKYDCRASLRTTRPPVSTVQFVCLHSLKMFIICGFGVRRAGGRDVSDPGR